MTHRQFTREQKVQALQRLSANRGDVIRTAREIGVTPQTIYKWKQALKSDDPGNAHASASPSGAISDEAVLQRLYGLEDRVLSLSEELSNTISEAIKESPLNQRVTALTQLIDRAMKMAADLPPRQEDAHEEDIALSIFSPEILHILDTRPDHTPSESDSDLAE
jgi:transposase-like protein